MEKIMEELKKVLNDQNSIECHEFLNFFHTRRSESFVSNGVDIEWLKLFIKQKWKTL